MPDKSDSPQNTVLQEIDMAGVPLTIAEQREIYDGVRELLGMARELKAVATDETVRESAFRELFSKIPAPLRMMLGI